MTVSSVLYFDPSRRRRFQTLGYLRIDDRIALLSIDFDTGRTIQLTGRGTIRAAPAGDPYADRILQVALDEIRATWPAVGRWTDLEPFRLRPGLTNRATPFL